MHRWTAIGLLALLIPISLSGALLVWHDVLDTTLYPDRYATTRGDTLLPPAAYLANAVAALPDAAQPVALRFPAAPGGPVVVTVRAGWPIRPMTVYLDPPNGRVLDVVDARASFFGVLHRFHENLTIPEYSGRQIVGWAGTGMLVLSLSGLWLWWPRNVAFLRGLRWHRSPAATANIHHLIGFWISLPLALVSATGIYLAFPQTARSTMSAIATMTPQGARPGAQLARETSRTVDQALAAALASEPGTRATAIFTAAPDPRAGEARSLIWRVQLRRSGEAGDVTVLVDDRTGTVYRAADPLAGDRAAQMIRWLHEGSAGGTVWRAAVFLCGIMPSALGVTGIVVWLRGRRQRKQLMS